MRFFKIKLNNNNIMYSRMNSLIIVIYITYVQILITNSDVLMKLNNEEGKITNYKFEKFELNDGEAADNINIKLHPTLNDPIFAIITSTVKNSENTWVKKSPVTLNFNTSQTDSNNREKSINIDNTIKKNEYATTKGTTKLTTAPTTTDNLDCGKPVNFTYYDDLIGIAQRFNHPSIAEPEVAYLFLKNKNPKSLENFDIKALERRLRKAKLEKPKSVQLYNQIGNYWRIKGDAKHSIECFRRALSISPTNAEVLLNLATVLFNLQYLDDAILLTRRSLEVQPADRSAWRQYFTLGEIFKAYGHFQESIFHLRHALELYPQHEPIKKALRDVENIPASPLHIYTVLIIICLVMGVLLVILSSAEGGFINPNDYEQKCPRHFNRAMAMRSLKGLTQRSIKCRKF